MSQWPGADFIARVLARDLPEMFKLYEATAGDSGYLQLIQADGEATVLSWDGRASYGDVKADDLLMGELSRWVDKNVRTGGFWGIDPGQRRSERYMARVGSGTHRSGSFSRAMLKAVVGELERRRTLAASMEVAQ